MNKKLLAVMGISGAVMLGSVYSISANTSGYELYKSALKQTHEASSATMKISLNLENNEKTIFSAESLVKADVENQVKSISTEIANETETSKMSMNKQDGNWFVQKDGSDDVYQMEMKSPHHKNTTELQDDLENLIDVMTKNLQQQITVAEKKNGNHTIELDLVGKEIPLTANALSTLMIKHAVMIQDNNDQEQSEFHIKPSIPELNHDITVKQVTIAADVSKDNYVEKQSVKAVVTGKDKQGKSHELLLTIDMEVSDYNNTSVAPVEIPTEKVIKLDMSQGHGRK